MVRTVGGDSDSGVIGRGVRQGCPLSPLLFSIYAEVMMIEALEDMEEGVFVGGQLVSDARYGGRYRNGVIKVNEQVKLY